MVILGLLYAFMKKWYIKNDNNRIKIWIYYMPTVKGIPGPYRFFPSFDCEVR